MYSHNKVQTGANDCGGYYHPNIEKTEAAMRPCKQLNDIIAKYNKQFASATTGNRRSKLQNGNESDNLNYLINQQTYTTNPTAKAMSATASRL